MADTFRISQSKYKTYLECKNKYYYRHVEKLTRRSPANPLVRGKIIHEMIEAQVNGKDPWKAWAASQKEYAKLFTQEREEYGDIPGEIEVLMSGYFDWFKRDPLIYYEVNGAYAEHFFRVPLVENIVLEGTMDSLAHTKDKRFWLVEHKSHKSLPKGDIKYSDIQSSIYTWVAPQVGLPKPDGVMWNYIRYKAPTIPEPLKNGEMSRAKSIDTTWAVYREALVDNNLDPKDYKDVEAMLKGKEGDFYVRVGLPINKTIQATILDEVKTTALEMRDNAGKNRVRTIDQHCTYCEFYELCQAELRGLDADFIRKKRFKVEEKERYGDIKIALTPQTPPKTQGGKKAGK